MRLASRALVAALVTLTLCFMVSAQTLRDERDPRNPSPTTGTGGPPGGATGLFTIYDGETLRRGEFFFSIAYSDYHRDPGSAHFEEIPLSFSIGLNDHIEVWFNTIAYRGVKVDRPQNLSAFYLPNSMFNGSPAIILAPNGPNVGTLAGVGATFRPFGNQPFVQFPYVGGSAGTFGLTAGVRGGQFGFPGFSAAIGTPIGTGGRFSGASLFPGLGAPVGGILPGIVLATTVLPATALTQPITVPTVYTTSPSYLPDAPFLNRVYGESTFGTFVIGGKFRLTGPRNPLGVAVLPFYRFYKSNANDFAGFNNLQRGASPGANFGDFGVVGIVGARLGKHINASANVGYVWNSNPRSTAFGGGNVTLLDRPNEVWSGVGIDAPVNKHVQIEGELRATQYVGSSTPNAFNNNPVEGIIGAKFYPRRWFGVGAAYRGHLNSQSLSRFNPVNFNAPITQLSGVNVVGRGVVIVPGTTVPATTGGAPIGFVGSDDPNGFIFQAFFGRVNSRSPGILPNRPPVISSFAASTTTVTLPCPPGMISSTCTPSTTQSVTLTTAATDPDGDTLLYTYSSTGGRVTGDGANATWDLTGVQPGTYTATVEVDDGCGCVTFSSTSVTVAGCTNCVPPCPTVTISCPTDQVQAGTAATVSVNLQGGAPNQAPTYNWSVSSGTITGGQGTPSITIDTTGQAGTTITASVEIGGLPPECDHSKSCSFQVAGQPPKPQLFDTYGNIAFNDEKARLDNFAIQLQNTPGENGYIIAYGSCEGEAMARANRAKDYLVTTRGIDASRITTVDGGCRTALEVQLWLQPSGATAPAADTTNANAVTPCPACKPTRRRAPRRRRR